MNKVLSHLPTYPFEALRHLLLDVQPNTARSLIDLSTSEPRQAAPRLILRELEQAVATINHYPTTKGLLTLRQAIVTWLKKRFTLPNSMLNEEEHILPINGIRDGLFSIAQTFIDTEKADASIIIPNPFYSMYEGVGLLSRANIHYLPVTAETNFLPDFTQITEQEWMNCQIIYLSSPSNPHGKVIDRQTWQFLLDKSDQYNFIIVSDECYSDIYIDEKDPPIGLLQVCAEANRTNMNNCLILQSLSKESNAPGMRSGFIAGDAQLITQLTNYRTYQGATMPLPIQHASIVAWQDEQHVKDNRAVYRAKREAMVEILTKEISHISPLTAGFYLWLPTPSCDRHFTRFAYQQEHLALLPGSLLSRTINGQDPGYGYVRIAITANLTDCIEGARRLGRVYSTYRPIHRKNNNQDH